MKKPQTNGKLHLDNGNGGVKAAKDDADAEEVLIPEEVPLNPLKRSDSRKDRQKRISFRGLYFFLPNYFSNRIF